MSERHRLPYDSVIDINPKGEYTDEAVHGSVLL